MHIDERSIAPLYVQIADAIEEDILQDKLREGTACYSQLIIAKELNVNPATAAKGINLLVSRGILEKQRGLAMTIRVGAKNMIMEQKRQKDFEELVENLIKTAKQLQLDENYIHQKISFYYKEESVE